jgi:hypothetical protein
MPEGPAARPGRSEAESIDDAEHGASIRIAMVRCLDLGVRAGRFCRETYAEPEQISARFPSGILRANLDAKTCSRAARSSCTTCAQRQRHVIRPTMA